MAKLMEARYPGICKKCMRPFPLGTMIIWEPGQGATHQECPKAPSTTMPQAWANSPVAPEEKVDLTRLIDFLLKARHRGLIRPRLRLLAPDGRSELQLILQLPSAQHPNAINVKISGTWIGQILPDGTILGPLRRPDDEFKALRAALKTIGEDPIAAAKRYAALSGRCMFCNLLLTDDGSVKHGYGPICASSYDLPWAPEGVRVVAQAPTEAPAATAPAEATALHPPTDQAEKREVLQEESGLYAKRLRMILGEKEK
jgi:hypothetical protein